MFRSLRPISNIELETGQFLAVVLFINPTRLVGLEFGVFLCFCGGRKTGEPGEKPLEEGREPTTNSTHI